MTHCVCYFKNDRKFQFPSKERELYLKPNFHLFYSFVKFRWLPSVSHRVEQQSVHLILSWPNKKHKHQKHYKSFLNKCTSPYKKFKQYIHNTARKISHNAFLIVTLVGLSVVESWILQHLRTTITFNGIQLKSQYLEWSYHGQVLTGLSS